MLYKRGSDCFHYAVFDRLHLERADLLKLVDLHLKFLKLVKSTEGAWDKRDGRSVGSGVVLDVGQFNVVEAAESCLDKLFEAGGKFFD